MMVRFSLSLKQNKGHRPGNLEGKHNVIFHIYLFFLILVFESIISALAKTTKFKSIGIKGIIAGFAGICFSQRLRLI